MDIELLSKMVKELILDNDKVYLPGLGAFVAEVAPSTFSDRGYTINPPYRKLSFKTNADKDNLLSAFYASSNGIAQDVAERILESFSADLSKALEANRAVQIPGLGRMRLGRDGNIFFIADEELDVYPMGFGLEPISLKTHQKPASFDFSTLEVPVPEPNAPAVEVVVPSSFSGIPDPEEASEPVADTQQEIQADPEPVVAQEEEETVAPEVAPEVEQAAEPEIVEAPEPEPDSRSKKEQDYFIYEDEDDEQMPVRRNGLLISLLVLFFMVVLVVVGFIVLKNYFPDLLDRMLYTREELEILNYYK